MRSRQNMFVNVACSAALLGNSLAAFAQEKAPPKSERVVVIERAEQGAAEGQVVAFPPIAVAATDFAFQGEPLGQPGVSFNFLSSEMSFDSRVVKGAPFSAEAVTESVQSLSDGNRIVRKSTTSIYRDSEGRTRREQTLMAVGPVTAAGQPRMNIFINDPVANVNYILDPQDRSARKAMTFGRVFSRSGVLATPADAPRFQAAEAVASRQIKASGSNLQGSAIKRVQPPYPAIAKAAKAQGPVQVQVTVSEDGHVVNAEVVSGHPLLRENAVEAARQWEFKPAELAGAPVKVQGVLTFNFTLSEEANMIQPSDQTVAFAPSKARTEALGKQVIEGVEAEGTRSIITIPTGQIGNERPIEIVTERWFSPELQTVILSRHSDPRFGENTYRLTNINRSEPEPSLFQVPSDYNLKDDERNFELRMKKRSGEQ